MRLLPSWNDVLGICRMLNQGGFLDEDNIIILVVLKN